MSAIMSKAMERIMVNRLETLLGDRSHLAQFGFKTGKSTEDAWHHIMGIIKDSGAKYVLGIFVDFKGAFDYLRWDVILRRLEEIRCSEWKIWESYFKERSATFMGANGMRTRSVTRGCPQGSICGPYIWNMMMDQLLERLTGRCGYAAYADDLLLLVEGQSRAELEQRGGEIMELVQLWGIEVGVELSAEKTVTMLLRGSLIRSPTIRVENRSLKYVREVKYLGIRVSERMNFLCHLRELRSKITGLAGQMSRICRKEWGLGRRASRIIYRGLYVACAAYGASVWHGVLKTVMGRKMALSCQNVMLRSCLPVCRTVSTDAMQVLMGVPPLDLEILRMAMRTKTKRPELITGDDWITGNQLRQIGMAECRRMIDEKVMDKWQERWIANENGRTTYEFIGDVRTAANMGRNLTLHSAYILTGHGSMNAYLYKRALGPDASCVCGSPVEDWYHILCECALYSDIRDFNALGIDTTNDNGRLNLRGIMESDTTYAELRNYAAEVFRRKTLTTLTTN